MSRAQHRTEASSVGRSETMKERFGRGALVALAAIGAAGCGGSEAAEAAPPSEEVAVVERGDLEIRVEASGQVEPILVVEVKSKASGEVTELHVETGDRVERGELLAEVDPRDVRNALAQAEADLVERSMRQFNQRLVGQLEREGVVVGRLFRHERGRLLDHRRRRGRHSRDRTVHRRHRPGGRPRPGGGVPLRPS